MADFNFSETLDKKHLIMMYEDDAERASVIFQIFVDGIQKEIELLQKLEKEGSDMEFIRKIHKIAPNFAMVGLTSETEALAEMESDGKAEGVTPSLRKRFSTFIAELPPKLALVQNELARIKNHLEA